MPHHALAYVFFGHVNIDYDGSPTAYGPRQMMNPQPDDDLTNAGNATKGWFGVMSYSPSDPLVTSRKVLIDPTASQFLGKFPVIQRKLNGDPNPGFYVSTTPQAYGKPYLQNSYIDASRVPFGALDGRLRPLGLSLGDYGLAIRHDQNLQSAFYFVDSGATQYALGECSHRVGKDLGGTGRGSHFNNNYPVSFIIFPRSGTGPPKLLIEQSDATIQAALRPRLFDLSRASNAQELCLLMGFNEVAPTNLPRGKAKLDEYLRNPGRPKPSNYATILLGLATFGFQSYLPSPKKVEIF
ncbi:MAG: hypothetical protein LAQ69_45095 [Acidobacteriia bacterium]|nr:hypothetical protein [Terriglobia bacterium]